MNDKTKQEVKTEETTIEEVKTEAKAEEAKAEEAKAEESNVDNNLEAIIIGLKEGYEKKLAEQSYSYEKRLEERNKVINQLLLGGGNANPPKDVLGDINARREAQTKKW